MLDAAPPILFAILSWWIGTGAVIVLDGLPRRTFRTTLVVTGLFAVLGLFGMWALRDEASPIGAYLGFACGIVVWGWHELAFLMGWVTGPRKRRCPPDARGWRRFVLATRAVIHHELALFATLLLIAAMSWSSDNRVGLWTFAILWVMRLSSKLNLFMGVRNVSEEFIPEHLRYLVSYFKKAPMNPLMPFSLLASSVALFGLARHAWADASSPFSAVGVGLVMTLLALAILEHIFLVLPVPDAVLWRWALKARGVGRA
jgi:putative photosynthetic complex assembly protein 2